MIIPGVSLKRRDLWGWFSTAQVVKGTPQAPDPGVIGSKPAHRGKLTSTGPRISTEDWRKSGGTTLLYMSPPTSLGAAAPRTFGYRIPSPVSPLLGLGFGLNLALYAAEYFGVNPPGEETDPWGEPMAY